MGIKRFESRVLKIIDHTSDVKVFWLSCPDDIEYSPGQFAMLSLKIGEESVRRPYSISCPKGTGRMEFAVRLCADGKLTPALFRLKEGDKINIDAPFGKFIFDENDRRDAVFIAGGTGIAPLRCMY